MAAIQNSPALEKQLATTGTNNSAASSTTPTLPAQFNSSECAKYLASRHTAVMEALGSSQTPTNEKPELYKPPGLNSHSGGWASPKYTSMANGSDFLGSIMAKIDQQMNHHPPHLHQHQPHQHQHHPHHPHHHHHHHQQQQQQHQQQPPHQHQHKPIPSSNHHPHHYPTHPQKQPHQH
ncbi:hypothetical protein PCANC_05551 [Puccinia coronata f. sp. avenae]|nr:hypothetical protein PCANC_15128 [Puccinia coronata f. sp. avenae]PLW51780.1 hypothetical protein PCANC_05551 [Puccinia coronata f. sp. avenae]